ncbi:MAG: acetylxylan esterase [Planctomycetes bacterium]|nr:acetylxylan esterase [Planctomycetota bacterium]
MNNMLHPTCRHLVRTLALAAILSSLAPLSFADDAVDLGKLSPDVLSKEQRGDAAGMIERDIGKRFKEANVRNREDWLKITTREQWEKFRDERIAKLRTSLGDFPAPPEKLNVRVTGTVMGDGFNIENVVYESRPGQWVTGNLYVPAKPGKSMPGILIAHSHHRDKFEGELQDMGMTWARAGCLVLVIDQVGYGERRSHPFNKAEDYAKPYRTSRQDYMFRYDTGVQLQLLGDSLMGWFAWDQSRGVDLLLARPGIDPKRIIILGAVAGGGDPAGVTAALDSRIACSVPFNFGGPQPESKYPLPDDAETSFNYLGGSYWDSTRGLRLGGRDGFFHWVITASTAPRALIHAHEFALDKERDPVWKRYQKIWGDFYGAGDKVGIATGKGTLKGRPPEASHCNNIGSFHRKMIHPLFDRWFGIKVAEADEYSARRQSSELVCMTEKARQELNPKSLNEVLSGLANERIEKARKKLETKSPVERHQMLREDWTMLLGPIAPAKPVVKSATADDKLVAGAKVERILLEVEPGIVVPIVVLSPAKLNGHAPVVVAVAQAGKEAFLKDRTAEIQKLIEGGMIVVLPDVRGTGETRAGNSHSQDSNGYSTNMQLFGETMLGQRLRDLRSVLTYTRERKDVAADRISLWGDSFTPPNGTDTDFKIPRGVDNRPREAEPLGGLLALLGTLFEDNISAVYIAGGLASYHSILTHFAVLIPHDAAVPGALTAGDLCDLAGSLAPRPLRLEAMVDQQNRTLSATELKKAYEPAVKSYSSKPEALSFGDERTSAAKWFMEQGR